MNNKLRGFSLVEAMIAIAIIAGSSLLITGSISDIQKKVTQVKLTQSSQNNITELINTFTTSAHLMQVDYSNNPTFPTTLPIAWDTNGQKMLVANCATPCPLLGRMAVLITPTPNKKLFMLRVKLTYPTWASDKESAHIIGAE